MRVRALLLCLVCTLPACVKYPEPYRPPVQRQPMEYEQPERLSHYIAMSELSAPRHFVSDVVPELHDDNWRWTMQRPTFKFQLPTTLGLSLAVDYTVPDLTFKRTGPVKITVYVEGHKLDDIVVNKDKKETWKKEVPSEWLTTERPVVVRLEIDKMWTSDHNEMRRGFIITGIGFVQ